MHVCMICPRYVPERCGVGDYTALLARYLAARDGVEVTVVTSRRPRPDTMAAGNDSVRDRVRVTPLIDDWGWPSLPKLCSIALEGRYDVIHTQYQNVMYNRSAAIAALPVALRALRPRLATVVTVHDYGTPWPKRLRVRAIAGPYGKAWFASMLLASTRVVLTNEQDEWRFLRQRVRYPVPASRYATIPLGSNLPHDVAPRRLAGPGEIAVGYFGFVNPAKGVETLLEGVAVARRRCPTLRLLLVCALRPDDPYHRRLLERLDAADLRGAVTVTGELDDAVAAATLAGCDMVALPFRDGVSLRRTTLMAALALGRPVVSTYAEVPPAALQDGRDLMLVPPSDAQALGQAIAALASDPARCERLGANALAASRLFTWPEIAARTEALYHEVLA